MIINAIYFEIFCTDQELLTKIVYSEEKRERIERYIEKM